MNVIKQSELGDKSKSQNLIGTAPVSVGNVDLDATLLQSMSSSSSSGTST
jgi:hypothetical protein